MNCAVFTVFGVIVLYVNPFFRIQFGESFALVIDGADVTGDNVSDILLKFPGLLHLGGGGK